jgi:hypothetical protein
MKGAKRADQSLAVLWRPAVDKIDIVSDARRAVDDRCDPADKNKIHSGVGQQRKQLVEGRIQ